MVLRSAKLALLGAALCAPFAAHAQQYGTTAPIIDLPNDYDEGLGATVGPFVVTASGEAGAQYDSNIYAQETGAQDDLVFITAPRFDARLNSGPTQISIRGEAQARKYVDHSSEDATSALAGVYLVSRPSGADQIQANASWNRAIEDRGDPEARRIPGLGPRKFDIFAGEASWNHDGPKIYFGARGGVQKINYLSSFDAERDLTIYSGQISTGYRISGSVRAIVVGFANHRAFRLDEDVNGINRDATTYGVRGGLRFGDEGIIRGEATVGTFRLDPKDPSLPSRSGLSLDGSLSYLPSRRVALFLDIFRGDVATVRSGAQSRTDTRVQFGVQAEARRNLRMEAALVYRRSAFIGTGTTETTKGVRGEVEYRVTPNVSIAATANYSNRDSDRPIDEFDRLRTGVEFRARF